MIVPIVGNVTNSITLDPTVWIFDERKVLLEEAFNEEKQEKESEDEDTVKAASERFSRAINPNSNDNKGINKKDGEEILKNSYVMPIHHFLGHAGIKDDASNVILMSNGEEVSITLSQLENCYLLFAKDGKALKEDGPVHLYFKDGSNKEQPIKNINKIIIQ